MPSIVRLLLQPDMRRPAPPPARVDLRRVLLGGIAAWALALAVSAVLLATSHATVTTIVTCVAGILLGGAGLLWERRNRRSYRGDD
ncbi:DUF2530 domain-containing protein [Isoptericola sp. NEAU-Y5]|uniref:DUF2530 domain-containing protein n=1 Tax=Isoptericola luteus TaxID=2879484 RepID=A0ABS7ZD92_9MICO|nr:DUF2530 domain-containing protein [Isoptericola sp. NEAU-Y5]MCA5893011.1 DUF2530 domain-containing protein [Isoptericola sp. NEAU-Y5]